MTMGLTRRKIRATEFRRMADAGVFNEGERLELLEGEIVAMSPIGKRHASCVARLTEILVHAVGDRGTVWVQNPIALNDTTEPVPDLALLTRRDDYYAAGLPTGPDLLLIIEVSDTTLASDRAVKVPLYARAGIAEVWLIHLEETFIEVFREPRDGVYQTVRVVRRGDIVSPTPLPDVLLSVDRLVG